MEGENGTGWARVRETVPPGESPAIAVQGFVECVSADQLRRVPREPAFPAASPWYSGSVAELESSEIALINTSESAVTASGCYSSGSLFSVPGVRSSGLEPVCSETFEVQVPPFGTRRFPVRHGSTSQFSIRTHGGGIVLQMLRPVDAAVQLFKVDSSIQFGGEISPVK